MTDTAPVPDQAIADAHEACRPHWQLSPYDQLEIGVRAAAPAIRADEREGWLKATECPSPCDPDCELRPDGCHEEHDLPSHRTHQPWHCNEVRLAIAAAVAAEREHQAALLTAYRKLYETWRNRASTVRAMDEAAEAIRQLLEGDS